MIDPRNMAYEKENDILNYIYLYVRLEVVLIPQYNSSFWSEPFISMVVIYGFSYDWYATCHIKIDWVFCDAEQTFKFSLEKIKPFHTHTVIKRSYVEITI